MDKQQLFLANNIFDIDSALDRLEENLFTSSDEKSPSAISTEPLNQQQKVDTVTQQQNKDFEEKNGNLSLSDDGASEVLEDNKCKRNDNKISSLLKFFCVLVSVLDSETGEVDDSIADTTTVDEVIRSEVFDNGVTQTISVTSLSANDKTPDSITSSIDSSERSSNSSDERDNQQHNHEVLSQVTSQIDNDDSSKQFLISEESSIQPDDKEQQDNIDDQPVTTDLTLTKTVELTENDQEPVPEPEAMQPESEQKTFNANIPEIVQPVEIEMVKQVEEPNDVKEMSHNNFESTMDDISDAELESLEQELEDLVAVAEFNVEKASDDVAVKALEESIKEPEVDEETAVIETTNEPETSAPAEKSETTAEVVTNELPDDLSEIQEISVISENDSEHRESSVSEAQEAVEPSNIEQPITPTDPDPVVSTSSTDESTSIQNLPSQSNEDFSINESNSTGSLTSAPDLGRVPPYWIPDEMTNQCMQCDLKFSLIKRRHHCRACGLLLCSTCCNEKFFLHYLGTEGRICRPCHEILVNAQQQQQNQPRNPNPANPMEYCSTLPPQQQVSPNSAQPPTVMVPSGVLKRGPRSSERKSVIFSDGIRPGTDLDDPAEASSPRASEKPSKLNMPTINEKTNSFIPESPNELPPVIFKESEFKYLDNNLALLQRLRQEELKYAINKNFYVTVKIVTRKLCNNFNYFLFLIKL